jgi:hypothetical protein
MAQEHAPAGPTGAVGDADRRALAELPTGPEPAADDRTGPTFLRRTIVNTVEEILAAGRRSPAPTLTTVADLAACRPGTVVTDRDGEPWIRNAAGQWRQAERVVIYPYELVEWGPLTRHLDGAARRAPGSHLHD